MDVNSDFPQARLLMDQEDYATSSVEGYTEEVSALPQLDQMIKYQKMYSELDEQVLCHLEQCFSSFIRFSSY